MSQHVIHIVASFSGSGGVERMLVNLINVWCNQGHQVHLVLIKDQSPYLAQLPSKNLTLHKLETSHALLAVKQIKEYLLEHHPAFVLVAKDRAGRAVIKAAVQARKNGFKGRIYLRLGTNLSEAIKNKSRLGGWLRLQPIKKLYPKLDGVIAVSKGVAEDTVANSAIKASKVHTLNNPVVTKSMLKLSQQHEPHRWLDDPGLRCIISVGRMTLQKDFEVLIRAFAQLKEKPEHVNLKLIIVGGDGGKKAELEQITQELDVDKSIDFVGFQSNPYGYMSRADLFALSSRWEGSVNVLTEALALGIPCVSTDCPSGPSEILQDGKYGPLVPVGDFKALAFAIEQTLKQHLTSGELQQAAAPYEAIQSAQAYLELLSS